jgi:methyl-accepting chemotaxis protein
MFEQFSIRVKLIAALLLVGIVCIVSINLSSFYLVRKFFLNASFESFTAIREIKKQQIESYFQQIRNQCHTFAQDTMIVNAMKEFKATVYKVDQDGKYSNEKIAEFTEGLKQYYKNEYLARLNPNVEVKRTVEQYFKNMQVPTIILQHFYIAANPNPTGKKDNLNMANDGSAYSKWHGKYHPIIREFLKKFGYYDIFLIDIETGTIAYTVFKEVDYITSLITGPFKNTNFAQVFLAAQEAKQKDEVKIVDFEYYDPSYGAPAAFIAAPIFDQDKKVGVLAFQFPIDKINQIMTNDKKWKETGLGDSGEMYLIGQDFKMRTVSRFLEEDPKAFFTSLEQSGVSKQVIDKIRLLKTTILIQEINTQAAHEVMRGNTGTILTTNYRNIPVVSSFTPLAIEGLKWGLIAEIDESEVLAPVKKLAWIGIIAGLLLLLLLIIFSIFIVRIIVHPIRKMIASMQRIVRKKDINLHDELISKGNDEIAELIHLINAFINGIRERIIAIVKIKKELQAILSKVMSTAELFQIQDAATHELMQKTMHSTDELAQKLSIINNAATAYQKYMHDMSQIIEQVDFFVISLAQSHASIDRTISELQYDDQKLLSLLEKEVFDMRQAVRYLDDGVIASAKTITKTILADAENAANATRISSSKLDQAMILLTDWQTNYQKITVAIKALKTHVDTTVQQLANNTTVAQQSQTIIEEFTHQLEKIQKTSKESQKVSTAIVNLLKMLDKHIMELDDSIKRFSL